MIVRAKIGDGYRGEPTRFVTVTGGGQFGSRLTPAEARQLARDLDAAADAAEALVIPPDLRRMGSAVAEAARTGRQAVYFLAHALAEAARTKHQSEPHSFKECQTYSYTRTPCERCR